MLQDGSATPAVFSPNVVASINRAYSAALDIIAAEGGNVDLRAKLAEIMMHLAKSGETDEARLCQMSVVRTLGRRPWEEARVSDDRDGARPGGHAAGTGGAP